MDSCIDRRRWLPALLVPVALALVIVALGPGRGPGHARTAQSATWTHVGAIPLPAPPALPVDVAALPRVLGQPVDSWLVADGRNPRLLVLNRLGETVDEWPTIWPPMALAVDASRDRVVVLSYRLVLEGEGAGARERTRKAVEVFALDGTPGRVEDFDAFTEAPFDQRPALDLSIAPDDGRVLVRFNTGLFAIDLPADPVMPATLTVLPAPWRTDVVVAGRIAALPGGRLAFAQPEVGVLGLFDREARLIERVVYAPEDGLPVDVAYSEGGDAGAGELWVLRQPSPEDPDPRASGPFDVYDERLRFDRAVSFSPSWPADPPAVHRADLPRALTVDPARESVAWIGDGDRATLHMHTLFEHPNRAFDRDFGWRPPAWDSRRKHAANERALALDLDPGGGRTLVLDAREARIVALPDGAAPPAATPAASQDERALSPGANVIALAVEARDLAVGQDRRVYVSSLGVADDAEGGRTAARTADTIREVLGRNAAPDPVDPRTFACDCPLGGRLAVAPDRLYVTRPISRETGVLPFGPGPAPALAPPAEETFGLWPADVAVSLGEAPGEDFALTADLIAGEVRRWDGAGNPSGRWPAGLLAGPRRITAGRLPDGSAAAVTLHTDGYVELHRAEDGGLLARFLPTDGEGQSLSADDVVLDGAGRILVSDTRTRRIHVFAPDPDAPPAEATPTPGPSPTPSDGSCIVRGAKLASPAVLPLGETVTVTLGLAADCPPRTRLAGADIVLVLDRSGSMYGEPLAKAKEAATAFAGFLDVRYHRAAIVSFAGYATLETALTDDTAGLIRAIDRPEADGGTNLAAALQLAASHLETSGRADALPVIVLLTDGEQTEGQVDPLEAAADVRARGMQLYTVGLGSLIDADSLRAMAGDPARYFEAPTPDELFPIYREVLRLVVTSLAGNLIVDDTLSSDQPYVAGSARPPALEQPDRLRWGRSLLPAAGITLTYRVRPTRAGLQDVGAAADLRYTDADGIERRVSLAPPQIEVLAPPATLTPDPTLTPSPTTTPRPTLTPTVTPTPAPVLPIYMPALWRNACLGGDARIDVALVIDISSSMTGTKIDRARAAAATFVDVLFALSPGSRAAVVAFDERATIAATLSDDGAALREAIFALRVGRGTRIDRALTTAGLALAAAPGGVRHRGVVILLSDGSQIGDPAQAVARANSLRAAGITIYAVGLGADVDRALLQRIADPRRLLLAPGPSELVTIYRTLAREAACR